MPCRRVHSFKGLAQGNVHAANCKAFEGASQTFMTVTLPQAVNHALSSLYNLTTS